MRTLAIHHAQHLRARTLGGAACVVITFVEAPLAFAQSQPQLSTNPSTDRESAASSQIAVRSSEPTSTSTETETPSRQAPPTEDSPSRDSIQVEEDDFDFQGRLATNFQLLERGFWTGSGGVAMSEDFLAPLHQSVSARALRIDSPLGKDSIEMQVAAYGRVGIGERSDLNNAYWDVSTAYFEQRLGPARVALGRQVMAGGAARYSRFDGFAVKGDLPVGVHLSAYGGLTVLPRFDQQYGYHYLGSSFETWSTEPNAQLEVPRGESWLLGTQADWRKENIGSLGLSYHYQAENDSLTRATLGMKGSFSAWEPLEIAADALLSTDSGRFSEVRVSGIWEGKKWDEYGLQARAELLHVVPSLLLSQASVFSVFAIEELTEAGAELGVSFPYRISLEASAYGQMYQEGDPGYRAQLGARYQLDDEGTLLARAFAGRFDSETNGYWVGRASLSYQFLLHFRALGDLYQYKYDEQINQVSGSTFYAMHLMYEPNRRLSARLGGSISRTPRASVDAQMMARVEYHFDRSERF